MMAEGAGTSDALRVGRGRRGSMRQPAHGPRFNTFSRRPAYADGALAYITTDPGGVGDFAGPGAADTNQAWTARGPCRASFGIHRRGQRLVRRLLSPMLRTTAIDDDYNFWPSLSARPGSRMTQLPMGPEFAYNNLNGDDPAEDGDLWVSCGACEASF